MEKKIFNYTGSTRNYKKPAVGDVGVVTMSSMSEMYVRAVWYLSEYAYKSGYIDTMNKPLYLFRIKSLKPKSPIYDHIPGF